MTSEEVAAKLSTTLRMPGSPCVLNTVQAEILCKAHEGATQARAPVGSGRAPLMMLLPVVMEAKHPAIVLPAAFIEKYRSDFLYLRKEWLAPPTLHSISVESLNRKPKDGVPGFLDQTKPDVIIVNVAGARGASQALATVREWAAKNGARVFELT